MERKLGNGVLEVVEGNLTTEDADAIVNAANKTLLGGGGVDGAIHHAGGPSILAECRKLGGCETGDAKITTGGDLKARHVIHTVGPVYRDGQHGEPEKLASCHRRSLEVAVENGLRTVSFPAISCGVYGYPIPAAARIALRTAGDFMRQHPEIERVRFVLFGAGTLRVFETALAEVWPE